MRSITRLFESTLSGRRWLTAVLVGVTIAPWLVGFNVPVLNRPRMTFTNPTRFPTGDGQFPMGAYLGFEWQILFRDHLQIDHNQKIWLAARSVDYQACGDGTVPFLITPMSNFIEFAIRLQNKSPRPIDYMAESPCGMAYVDVRSIIRGYRPVPRDGAMFQEDISFVSSTDNGQIIARIDSKGSQTDEARTLEQLRKDTRRKRGRDIYEKELGNSRGARFALCRLLPTSSAKRMCRWKQSARMA